MVLSSSLSNSSRAQLFGEFVGGFVLRRLEAAVEYLVLGMGMGHQLGPHFLEQTISFPSILAVRDGFEQRCHFLMVIVQVLQNAFCDAGHFFDH